MHNLTTRTLSDIERPQYAAHLKRLSGDDRYLRFSYMIQDQGIDKYVAQQITEHSTIIGAFDENANVIAAIVIEYNKGKFDHSNDIAEIGLSVELEYRGLGLGTQLFERALVQARNRGTTTLISHCLSQNRFMNKIATKSHMTVQSSYGESTGSLLLESRDLQSIDDELVGESLGMWDFNRTAEHLPDVK